MPFRKMRVYVFPLSAEGRLLSLFVSVLLLFRGVCGVCYTKLKILDILVKRKLFIFNNVLFLKFVHKAFDYLSSFWRWF